MHLKFNGLFSLAKNAFNKDRIGFILKWSLVLISSITIFTLPIFTFRAGYNTISLILSVLDLASFLLYFFIRGKFRLDLIIFPYIIFTFYCLISFLFTFISSSDLRSLILVYGLFFITYETIVEFKLWKYFSYLFSFSAVLLAIFIFIENYEAILSLSPDRLGGTFGNLNSIGLIFSLASFVTLFLLIHFKKNIILLIVFFLIDLFFAILTGSRGALVVLFLSNLLLIYFSLAKKYKLIFGLVFIFAIVFAVIVLQFPIFSSLKDRLVSAVVSLLSGGTIGDASSNQRFAMFEEGLYLFCKSPIFGNGFGSFSALSNQGVYSHSNISEMLCNFGIIGSIIWIAPLIYAIAVEKNGDNRPMLLSLAFGVVLFGSCFNVLYSNRILLIFLAIVLGMFSCSNKISQVSFSFRQRPFVIFDIRSDSFLGISAKF